MFQPPRCPNRDCRMHRDPQPDFWVRNGSYWPECRPEPVPRFRCRACRKSFSRQTFRADYRDHRPDVNHLVFLCLASGLGLRQTARFVEMSPRCLELKFRKIARHLHHLNLNLRRPLPPGTCLQLDEVETYEGRRNTRPLTLPVVLERESRFLVWARCAPIRPRGKMTPERRRVIAAEARRFGRRRDRSRAAVYQCLQKAAELTEGQPLLEIHTDQKSTYPRLLRRAFGKERICHRTVNSKEVRDTYNLLFPINNNEAIARDLTGRLRRESWLVSKQARYLDLQLGLFATWRNYMRRRFNYDKNTAAQHLGWVQRRMRHDEVVGWRQDWGELSIYPMARRLESVAEWRARPAS